MTAARIVPLAGLSSLFALTLLLAACGGGEASGEGTATDRVPTTEASPATSATPATQAATTEAPPPTTPVAEQSDAEAAKRPPGEEGLRVAAKRARIVVEGSEFGRVLFDGNGQVVYAFERDRRAESNCTSVECVKAWPPVLTRDAPTAGKGVDAKLLGRITRDDGSVQVTYDGRPLYFYEHEAPGEIRCHNVNLHGGLWWVLTPSGKPAP